MNGSIRSWAFVALSSIALMACGPSATTGEAARSGQPAAASTTSTTLTSPPNPTTEGLVVRVERSRLFETRRQLSLVVANHGPDDVPVERLQLRSPLFDAVAPDTRTTTLRADGRTVSIPITFGSVRCGDPDGPHEVLLASVDGTRTVTAELGSTVHDLWRLECAAAAVREAATITFGSSWTPATDGTMRGRLEIRLREPDRTLEITQLAGSVVFSIAAPSPARPLARVDDDDPAVDLPVTVSAARCDPHALIESKRTYVFVLFVRLDDEETTITLEPTGPDRVPFDRLLEPCLR